MKIDVSKEWCEDAAEREDGQEVGVDTLGMDQPLVKLRLELTTAQNEIERLTEQAAIDKDFIEQYQRQVALMTAEIGQLTNALSDCADRLESCAIAGGSDPEYAALAVKEYRELLLTKD